MFHDRKEAGMLLASRLRKFRNVAGVLLAVPREQKPENIAGRTVIVIDDGVATGNTLLATLRILRKQDPERLIVAAPVISKSAMQKLKAEADEVIAVLIPDKFFGVGAFYADFSQVSDDEVLECLQKLREPRKLV